MGKSTRTSALTQEQKLSYRRFAGYAAIAIGIALVPVLLWQLGSMLLMAFAAVLIAILLHVASEPLQRWTPLPLWVDLLISALFLLLIVSAAVWLFESQVSSEFANVLTQVRAGATVVQQAMSRSPMGKFILERLGNTNIPVTGFLGTLASTLIGVVEAAVVIAISAAYLAAEPRVYRAGVVRLFSPDYRDWADETLVDVGRALRFWLLGQFLQMVVIGLLSTLATWLIGLPSPLALGVIAGLTEFVPYLGPIAAAIPALLVAVTLGMSEVLWTLGAYILIHQAEGNLIMPIIQRRMIYVPPALMLLGMAAIAALAGIVGLLLAAPIVVTIFVIVQKAYVRDTLKEAVKLPGEDSAHGPSPAAETLPGIGTPERQEQLR